MTCNAKAAFKRTQERKKNKAKKNPKVYENLEPFYKEVWNLLPHYCFETGVRLNTYHNWHIHHVLEKKRYPEHKLNPDVCVLLTLEMHALWHGLAPSDRVNKMPKTWERFLQLKEKYDK